MSTNKYIWLNIFLLLFGSVIATDVRRVFPLTLTVREETEFQFRLTSILPDAISCYVRTPTLTSYNLASEESDARNRIIYWTVNGECGVRVKNVRKEDAGRWRLTAKNINETLVDTALIQVLDKFNPVEKIYSIESGLEYTLKLMEDTKYCKIQQPHSAETLMISGECKVELHQPSAAAQGSWIATAGVTGQLEEVSATVKLNVYRDKLETGIIRSNRSSAISMYCNLRDRTEGLEFCRFTKSDNEQIGYQLSEGLHNGRYGYYGAGLESGECGMTIETPRQEDFGQWLCTIGEKGEEPFGSFVELTVSSNSAGALGARVLSSTTEMTTSLDALLQLRCTASVAISYCWFLGPDRTVHTLVPSSSQENATYRYIGAGFGKGECGIEIKSSEMRHHGQWKCHLGPLEPGFELTSTIDVKIAETPLAAVNEEIEITIGYSLTLECRTVPEKVSLDYCRFFMPDGNGIHINDEVTREKPLVLDGTRYWFTGESPRLGGCGLTVSAVAPSHIGNWTCAARLQTAEDNTEAFDKIVVHDAAAPAAWDDNQENWTAGATTGIVTGVIVLVGLLAAGSVYMVKIIKARRILIGANRMRNNSISTANSEGNVSSSSTGSGIPLEEIWNPNRS